MIDPNRIQRMFTAIEMAKCIDPPVDYVGQEETKRSYNQWAIKAYRMADELIKRVAEDES